MQRMHSMPLTGTSALVTLAKILGNRPRWALVLKTRAKVNCQDKREPAQENTMRPMTALPAVSPSMYEKARPKGALDARISALGTMPAMTFVEAT